MLTKFRIKGFKRFKDSEFPISPLTVLTGLNGGGKTSFIQALLLVHQCNNRDSIPLNGPHGLQLGTAEDIANWESNSSLEFDVEYDNVQHSWQLEWDAEESMYLNKRKEPTRPPFPFQGEPRSFTYLSAERMGPRSSQLASSIPANQLEVEHNGGQCAQILAELGLKPIEDPERLHPQTSGAPFLKYEVERWLNDIARGVELEAARVGSTEIYNLKFRDPDGEFVSAPNMGFGITFSLPIIIAGLTVKRGGILIVENPEAHLHPAGQSNMGGFLAWLAARGTQVIVETHSDHLLNGIRRAVSEKNILSHEEAVVHFFDGAAQVNAQELRFTSRGGISHWPKGFFDQFVIDTASLGKFRRKETN